MPRVSALWPGIFALLVLAPLAAAHTLTGRVTNAAGDAVPGASVWLSVSRDARKTAADADGRFTFNDVPTGTTQVVALKDGLALGGASGQCIADTDITIVLTPTVSTRLRIINTRYAPLEGARLRKLEAPGSFSIHIEDLVPLGFPAPPSDAEGFLALPPLPAETFVNAVIGHAAYADGTLPALPSGEDIDLPLPDGAPIVGRIVSNHGDGVPNARVSVYRPRDDGPPLLAAEVLSGPEGFFAAMAPPGSYLLAAKHPRFGMPTPQPADARGPGETVVNLTLPEGRLLRGRALDTTDAPVPLAVFAYRVDHYIVAETVSDALGRFDLVVPPGDGVLHVRAPRRMSPVAGPRVLVKIGDAAETELAPLRFAAAPTLRGRIAAPDGAPAEAVLITSLTLDPEITTVSDANGEFAIELETIPEGKIGFRAEHALRFLRRDFEIDPASPESTPVELREYQPNALPVAPEWGNNLALLVDKPAPELATRAWFNLPEGKSALTLAELRGKVVVLFLWAGFDRSGPGRARLAEMNAIHRLYRSVDDVTVISIHDAAAAPDAVANFVRELGVEFPVGCDVESSETYSRYRTNYVPQTVLIDKKGDLRFYQTGGKLLEFIKLLRRE